MASTYGPDTEKEEAPDMPESDRVASGTDGRPASERAPPVPLAELNAHPRDSRITFMEEGHVYEVDGGRDGWISTTTFIHGLFPQFDADQIIRKMMAGRNWAKSKYHGMSAEEIKQQWAENGSSAAADGTAMHADIERLYNGLPPLTPDCKEMRMFNDFRQEFSDLVPWRTEMTIFDETVGICGSVDMVYCDPEEPGAFLIYDWKRSKAIKRSNYWENGSHPYTCKLPNCNFIHYSLQLGIYKRILQTRYGMKVNGTFLVVLHPLQHTFQRIETQNSDVVVEALFRQRQAARSIVSRSKHGRDDAEANAAEANADEANADEASEEQGDKRRKSSHGAEPDVDSAV
ncbi:hypothetical protein JKP88DRAFT_273036 [Tribonema minus]|uniref:PD-(D/E)XK endonuclease-like domain-containing protein n=1 Tax=Tribonema minus TaxID=303371 RepID=A0A835Z110_9STRA|nr:hypothetical protein JKP88DRAFT_273036 [Tribonema minus]